VNREIPLTACTVLRSLRNHFRPHHRAREGAGRGIAVPNRHGFPGGIFRRAVRITEARRIRRYGSWEMGVPVGAGTDDNPRSSYKPIPSSTGYTGKTVRGSQPYPQANRLVGRKHSDLHQGEQLGFYRRRKRELSPQASWPTWRSAPPFFFHSRGGDQASRIGLTDRGWEGRLCQRRILKNSSHLIDSKSKMVPVKDYGGYASSRSRGWHVPFRFLFACCGIGRWPDAIAPSGAG